MANVNITFNDPGGLLSGVPLLAPTIRAAVSYLDQFVVFQGILDINVNVETTSTGRFAGSGDLVLTSQRGGLETWESAMVAESRNGADPHPDTPDLSIFIDPRSSYLAGLWWDPNVGTSLAGRVPTDKTDAFSVVLHELLHGMGVIGWRNIDNGSLPSNYQSVWDYYVNVNGNRATFNGPATVALLGQGAEVRLGGSQGAYHLGNGPDLGASQMPWIEASNLNGYYFFLGERYLLGHLELALLQDLGWVLEPTTLTDVVNRYDDRVTARYMIGWETGDQISGDVLGDRLEGRGGADLLVGLDGDDTMDGGTGDDTLLGGNGNDALFGGSGNDRLDGGPGDDTAQYVNARSQYTVTSTVTGFTISGPEGTDTLTFVEKVRFTDLTATLATLVPNVVPTGGVVITGTARQDANLQTVSTVTDVDGLGSMSYRWQSSPDGKLWADIAGATATSLRPGESEVGKLLRVVTTYVDGRGNNETVISNTSFSVLGYRGGSGLDNVLVGSSFGDLIEGFDGNDRMTGAAGDDQIEGGNGLDKALYALARSSYSVTVTASGAKVQANSGSEGVDTLVGVERLVFADRSLALDLNGSAGLTARLIGAVFGPGQVSNREYVGIGLSLFDAGQTPLEVAQLAIDARMGAGARNADIVNTLYSNVVGFLPGAADLAYYTGLLDTRAYTPASLTLLAAETSLTADRIGLTGLQVSGLEYLGG